jgi:predicted transcriptional regulator
MTTVILDNMKTAISLPDDLFRRADALARRLGIPRSQLYAQALSDYVDQHSPSHITAALDAVYADYDSTLEPDLDAAQARAINEDTR